MIQKIAYLIDSSASYHEDPENDIYMMPLSIININVQPERIYQAGINMDLDTLANELAKGHKFKTGLVAIDKVMKKVEELLKTYDRVIGIPIDSQMSGTYNTWKIIENELGVDKFYVVDCKDVEYSIVWTLQDIKDHVAKHGFDEAKINALVKENNQKKGGTIVVNDVSQLIAGGRLKGFKATIVKALKLKILIKLLPADGHLEYFDKKRNATGAHERMVNYLDEKINWRKNGIKRALIVSTIRNEKQNQKILNEFKKILPENLEIICRPMSSIIAVHTGLDAYGIYLEAN